MSRSLSSDRRKSTFCGRTVCAKAWGTVLWIWDHRSLGRAHPKSQPRCQDVLDVTAAIYSAPTDSVISPGCIVHGVIC